jgi:methyl-accepting chemotaxis protein
MQRISHAIEAIRPVFDNVNGAVTEQNKTTSEMSDNVATTSHFIVSVGDSAAEIDGAAQEAAAHGEAVAGAGQAVTQFAQKLKSRCAVLLRRDESAGPRTNAALPCHLKIDIEAPGQRLAAPVYEISEHGVLISGSEAARLRPHDVLRASLQDIGECRLRIGEGTPAGVQARFEAASPTLREKIEDKLWALREENTGFVARAMEAGVALTRIFEDGVAGRAISIDDMFDSDYVEIPGTNPLQHRTRILDWADRALPPFQEAFLAKDPRMAFCVMIDRNGYLPVHNKIYSHPQRPGDTAFNTANSRNRRIFNDPAGLAAGRNQRPYLIQSYARDMGGGLTVMMREIDVPIRVRGRHWGGFRTAYKL